MENFFEKAAAITGAYEGCELSPYLCPAGKLTIGKGLNLERGKFTPETLAILGKAAARAITEGRTVSPSWEGLILTNAEASDLLRIDLEGYWRALVTARHWVKNLAEPARLVLLDMTYNMGLTGLMTFTTMWAALAVGDWRRAAEEMMDSRWARQVGRRASTNAEIVRGLTPDDWSLRQRAAFWQATCAVKEGAPDAVSWAKSKQVAEILP